MITRVAVLGAGTMGAQIAGHFANAGLSVLLLDLTKDKADQSIRTLHRTLPPPLFVPDKADQIQTGSFQADLTRIQDCGWVIEAVIENFEAKKELLDAVDAARRPGSLVTTNTSGLSVTSLAQGRSPDFKQHWFGTHFFNPPRYMRLLEVIPTSDTDMNVLAEFEKFAGIVLGKEVVRAKDTPNFIANRIGLFAMLKAMQLMQEYGLTIEEVDRLTGPLAGGSRSATFRTIDIVGVDVFIQAAANVYDNAVNDPDREFFRPPDFMRSMLEKKLLGAKTGGGFYKKAGADTLTLDLNTMQYRPYQRSDFHDLEIIAEIESLHDRLRALLNVSERPALLIHDHLKSVVGYAASRIPEISDDPGAVDLAMRSGFSWQLGPFEMGQLLAGKAPASGTIIDRQRIVHEIAGASLRDLGDGVALLEFDSAASHAPDDLFSMITRSLDEVQTDFLGLVIGSQGPNFSANLNLVSLISAIKAKDWEKIDRMIRTFQRGSQAIKYSPKPVVLAACGLTIGHGCEIALACARTRASAETYMGLIHAKAGLIPAGGGLTEMVARIANSNGALREAFKNIVGGQTSSSAEHARRMRYLRPEDEITMNSARLIHDAKSDVLRLSQTGFRPPPPHQLPVFGESAAAQLKLDLYLMKETGSITEDQTHVGNKLVGVLCGGDITRPSIAPAEYFLDLEREAFKSLCSEPRTLTRMEHFLKNGRLLRN